MFIFRAYDCSEEPQLENFVIKLGNDENATKFKNAFNSAREFNKAVKEGKEKEAVWAEVIKDEESEKKEEKKEEVSK